MKTIRLFILASISVLIIACGQQKPSKNTNGLSGTITIFHAGSLSVPFRQLAKAFETENPNVKVLLESAGSVASARKVTDLERSCDIMASADFKVIDEMLIPNHTHWNIMFAQNEISLVYGPNSRYSNELTADNWHEILMRDDVAYGRSDPNADPCGYRAVLCSQLAEELYQIEGLSQRLLAKDNKYIRPKEVDLLALLEVGAIDYLFLYSSVAVQHNLPFLQLPDSLNLKNPALAHWYASTSTQIHGKKPGEKLTLKGAPIVYGITIIDQAPNKQAAEAFLEFLLNVDKGGKIFTENGQSFMSPALTEQLELLPERIKKYCSKK